MVTDKRAVELLVMSNSNREHGSMLVYREKTK